MVILKFSVDKYDLNVELNVELKVRPKTHALNGPNNLPR